MERDETIPKYGLWIDMDPSLPGYDPRSPELTETDDLINLYWVLQNEPYFARQGVDVAGISVSKGNNPHLAGAHASLEQFLAETGYGDKRDLLVSGEDDLTNQNDEAYAALVGDSIRTAASRYPKGLVLLAQGPAHNLSGLEGKDLERISASVMWGHVDYRTKLGHPMELLTPWTGHALDAYNLGKDLAGAQRLHTHSTNPLLNWTMQAAATLDEESIEAVENPYIRNLLTLRSQGHQKQFKDLPSGEVYVWDLFFGLRLLDQFNEGVQDYRPTFETREEPVTVSRNVLGAARVKTNPLNGRPMDLVTGVNAELYRQRAVAGLNGDLATVAPL